MAFIEIEHLKYKYPQTNKLVLQDISLQIEQGEFIGVIGENGAGKSTLSQAIMGLVPQFYKGAYGGSVTIDGVNAATTPIATLCQSVGLVFQNPFNQLSGAKDTVYEEIAFGLQNLGIPREEMNTRIRAALELLDIAQYADRNPFDLSGGQMQRVAIASILVMEPKVMILDEPTSQLDPQGSDEVFKAVEALTKQGITIIMIEQKMEKIAAYCDRVILMQDGKVIDFDTPAKIFSREDINQYGIAVPVYTQICKELDVKNSDGTYPVNDEQMKAVINQCGEKLEQSLQAKKSNTLGEAQGECKEDSSDARKKEVRENRVEKVFQVENLQFSYTEGVPIIKNLSLCLDYRPTAIIGQNGAGKTTLVKLLKGLLKPSDGKILFKGQDIGEKTVASIAGQVGYVFQNPDDQIFKYSVLEEVMFGPLNIGMTKEQAKEHALDALKIVGMEKTVKENPYDLDLHQRKMIAIASVLAMDTDVIILDEPTIAQDYKGKCVIRDIILELQKKGKLVISILHDMDFVLDSFERVIVMAKGQILADGEAEEVFQMQQALEKARLEKPHRLQLEDMLKILA